MFQRIQIIGCTIAATILLGTFSADAEDELAAKLKAIHFEYINREQPVDIAVLVRLDQELRDTVTEINSGDWAKSRTYIKEGYGTLGLFLDHWNDMLQYSGLLLTLAHKQDPHSAHRKRTLYSTTGGDGRYTNFGKLPNINAAFQYVAEYPQGPFISEVYELLATFYDDFYKTLRKFMFETVYDDDNYARCFKPHMTAQPYEEQLRRTQVLGLHFYEKALEHTDDRKHRISSVQRKQENFLKMLEAVEKRRFERWYWCSDC